MQRSIRDLTDIRPNTESLENIKMEKLEWLWPNRIPLGKITMVVGDPGVGKSFWSLDVAAHITTGRPWPDDKGVPCRQGTVLLIGAEDAVGDTILPRLYAAKANMAKIYTMKGMTAEFNGGATKKEMFFELKSGIIALGHLKEQFPDLKLIIIDPITAYMGNIDSHDNAQVRSVLDKVAAWAADADVAVLAISHLNKNTTVRAVYRIMGSVAFTAVSRMVWHIVKDEENPERRLLLPGKLNMAPEMSGLAFRLQSVKVGDELIDSAVVSYEDKTIEETADEMLAQTIESLSSTKKRTAEWLKDILIDGPRLAMDIFEQAKIDGISESTVRRAKKQLQVKARKIGGGQWEWGL